MAQIDSESDLRANYPPVGERARRKVLDRLDRHVQRFIALAPLAVLSTVGADGFADASPRGGEPGFVAVLDDKTLLLPDWGGNNRLDSLSNLIANRALGMLFLVPGIDETVRVNGYGVILDDEGLRARCAERGRLPATVLKIAVAEAFFHCPKALMRAGLWDPARQVARDVLPTLGQILNDQLGLDGPVESQADMLARYRAALY